MPARGGVRSVVAKWHPYTCECDGCAVANVQTHEHHSGRPVRGEVRRAPADWQTTLDTIADTSRPIVERARLAREVAATRRRWRDADDVIAALDTMDASDGWAFTSPGRTRDEQGHRMAAQLRSVVVGGVTCTINGRWLPLKWRAEPKVAAAKMRRCEQTYQRVARESGNLDWQAHTCNQVSCPVCTYRRAGLSAPRTARAIAEYVKAGCTIVHLTSTQRVGFGDGPVVLTDAEAACMVDGAPWINATRHTDTDPNNPGTPTGGEHLDDAWARLDASLRASKWEGTEYRHEWARHVLAEVRGIECTGRDPVSRRLRWHVHAHRLLILSPETEIETTDETEGGERRTFVTGGEWWDGWIKRWCAVSEGADPKGQKCRVVARPGDTSGDLLRACRQTLKYPGKVSSMTAAQRCEYLAAVKGRHPHQMCGDFHATNGIGQKLRAIAIHRAMKEGAPLLPEIADADPVAYCKRAGIVDVASARAVWMQVHDVRGFDVTEAGCEAWAIFVRADQPEDLPEGSEAADRFAGCVLARVRGRARVVTRARLVMWDRLGLKIEACLARGFIRSDAQAERYRMEWWPEWTSTTPAALMKGDASLAWGCTGPPSG